MTQGRVVTWLAMTFATAAVGALVPAAAHAAHHRKGVSVRLHATAAAAEAEGEIQENVEDGSTGTGACCLGGPDEQGCSDLSAADCSAAGGRSLGPGTTCDVPEGGQDPCGDTRGCANEPEVTGRGLRGGLTLTVRHLAPRARFRVLVGQVPLGTIKANSAGRARKRFRGRRLTVDPRGKRITVTGADGTAVLTGVLSDPTTPCGVACCLNTDEEQGCADLTASDCTAAGGHDAGTGSCDPDPCPDSPSGAFLDLAR